MLDRCQNQNIFTCVEEFSEFSETNFINSKQWVVVAIQKSSSQSIRTFSIIICEIILEKIV